MCAHTKKSSKWFLKAMIHSDLKPGWGNPLKSNCYITQNGEPTCALNETQLSRAVLKTCYGSYTVKSETQLLQSLQLHFEHTRLIVPTWHIGVSSPLRGRTRHGVQQWDLWNVVYVGKVMMGQMPHEWLLLLIWEERRKVETTFTQKCAHSVPYHVVSGSVPHHANDSNTVIARSSHSTPKRIMNEINLFSL